jgi:archaemetzincin
MRAAAPIAVQPFGEVSSTPLEHVRRLIARELGASSVILPPREVPRRSYSPERGQHDAEVLLDELFDALPERCLRVIGVTEADLFIGGRTFVFGYAHLSDGMALCSLARLRESYYGRVPDDARLEARLRRAVVHELGHTFGVPHCEDNCVMHSVTHVESLDDLTAEYCELCRVRVERGLLIEPWSAHGRRERGLSWLRRGRPGRAAELLEHAIRCAPLEPALHHDLASARLATGDRAGAKLALRRAIELYGRGNPDVRDDEATAPEVAIESLAGEG